MKRAVIWILCTAMIFCGMPTVCAVGTSASSAVLIEAESGRVLYEHNAHEPRLIASITKLMTALVVLESGLDLDTPFPVPQEALGAEGSSIYLQAGEEVNLRTLLYGMLLASGNDAAIAAACRCAGNIADFSRQMNKKAAELGMTNSHFENPSGLNAEGHYSTAYDMALLARACLENEELAKIVSCRSITIDRRTFVNHNKLLSQYEGCIGLKTGYTKKAGRTLVSAASRGGMTLIAVTLNDPDDWKDHAALFDWGFDRYAMVNICRAGNDVGMIPLSESLLPAVLTMTARNLSYPVGENDRLEIEHVWNKETLCAPIQQGTVLGELKLFCNGEEAVVIPIVSKNEAHRNTYDHKSLPERLREVF